MSLIIPELELWLSLWIEENLNTKILRTPRRKKNETELFLSYKLQQSVSEKQIETTICFENQTLIQFKRKWKVFTLDSTFIKSFFQQSFFPSMKLKFFFRSVTSYSVIRLK